MGIEEGCLVHKAFGAERAYPHSELDAARLDRERQWLEREVAWAASLTDADRVRILRDLLRTADAIQRAKSPEENQRAEEARRSLDEPGRARYRALAARFRGAE
jgi:hypothetical protein